MDEEWRNNDKPTEEEELANLNAIAEISASRTDKYCMYVSELLNGIEPLPREPCFEDRVARFVWLGILNERLRKSDEQLGSDARTEELRMINLAIVDINKQLNSIPSTKGRRDTQIDGIITVIKELKLDALEIPEGKKKEIKNKCINSGIIFADGKLLFTESSFKRAWEEGGKRKLISMKNKKKYL